MGQRLEMFVNDCQTKAEKGVVEAQYDLGLLYSIGKGVPRDYVSAHKWFNLAALRGMAEAKDLRAELAALGWTMKDGKETYTLSPLPSA